MPSRTLVRSFVTLWWTVGFVVFFLSVRTVLHAVSSDASQPDVHALLLGTVEAIAAVLFLVPRTLRWGAIGLLSTFAVAFLVHATRREFAAPLLIYSAAVLFVLIHGPVPVWSRAVDHA